jgi:DNA-binding NarL/FixJ family response regulator
VRESGAAIVVADYELRQADGVTLCADLKALAAPDNSESTVASTSGQKRSVITVSSAGASGASRSARRQRLTAVRAETSANATRSCGRILG